MATIGTRAGAAGALGDAQGALLAAVRQSRRFSLSGLSEAVFARLFQGLVYAQIWEDPEVDLAAMAVVPGNRIVAIASGGCNALAYLAADPGRIDLVDLNPAHVAYNRLKLAALYTLPDHQSFFDLFGGCGGAAGIEAYERHVRPHLDAASRAYWEGRTLSRRRRIDAFAGNIYRRGLLGRFIGLGHLVARLHGVDPRGLLAARDMAAQRAFFHEEIAPLFDRPLVRLLVARRSALFGLGIPPQQHDALAEGRDMAAVLRERLEKLACGFPLSDNYFAWQAFGRCYAQSGPLPHYLQPAHFEMLKARCKRIGVENRSITAHLAARPPASVDRFVLLDAQDWMSDAQLDALWHEISRTAAPGARVIFRTAGSASVLPGRIAAETLARWDYRAEESQQLHARDRSGIYGGFHLHVLRPA